ncbi:MAG: hypothetical protein ACREV6_05785 [Clostridium sp.]|uniref:hypothetical protein n=1 Tax=Clostridium sp. TaxID=1506 RepID=UPI003D6C8E48
MDKNNQTEKETSESINSLYSNNNLEKHKTKSSEPTQLKDHAEGQKYIKEMHELADKNEFKNNAIVLGLFIVIAAIIVFSILMNTSFMKPKTDVVAKKTVTKSTVDSDVKTVTSQKKIYDYLDVEANRTSMLKKAVGLNKGSKTGVTVYLLSEILRSNDIAIPVDTSTVKQLATDLTSMGFKKNTDVTKLEKGDICFTTDVANKPGVPSHAYVFMGWVANDKTDYGNICDGQVQEYNNILHKRNISILVDEKDKFSFFLRK